MVFESAADGERNSEIAQSPYRAFPGSVRCLLAKLIAAREEAGLTQRDVGKRLGMSYTFVTKSESGDRRLDVMELIRLADLYGKPPEFFLKPE